MKYLSVCSGIEAASVAWRPLGFEAFAYSEIDKFPCAVLAHHYPQTLNFGDMTKFKEWPDATIDVLVGGTPCQSFSVAGLRKGLDDPRGNLTLTYLAIAAKYRPQWLVWENVPGILSDASWAFGAFLGGLGELGYGFAYRILDAQYFGVPQRRRRVFVVGHLGDWRRAAAVLFERHSLQGHPPPSREAGKRVAGTVKGGSGSRGYPDPSDGNGGGLIHCPDIAHATTTHQAKGGDPTTDNYVTHSLRAEGFDASEDGTGRGTPLIPIAFTTEQTPKFNSDCALTLTRQSPTGGGQPQAIAFDCKASNLGPTNDLASTMRSMGHAGSHQNGGGHQAVAFAQNTRDEVREMNVVGALASQPGMKQTSYIRNAMQVRRLTPRECERLQGFPDDYTLIPHTHGKPAADGPRYKALGNPMAVPVMRWIGERIAMVESIQSELEAA